MAQLTAAIGQRALYAILGAVAALLLITMVGGGGNDQTNDALVTIAKLRAAGWAPASGEAPKIQDRPRGSRPVAVVQGAVRYPALEPGKVPATGVTEVPPSLVPVAGTDPLAQNTGIPCDRAGILGQIAVDVRCRAELIELDGIPAARLFVSGRLELSQKVRELPETRADDVTLTAKLPPKLPRHIAIGAGLSTRPALIVNGTFYRQGKRMGWWGQYEQPLTTGETASVAGGVAVRF